MSPLLDVVMRETRYLLGKATERTTVMGIVAHYLPAIAPETAQHLGGFVTDGAALALLLMRDPAVPPAAAIATAGNAVKAAVAWLLPLAAASGIVGLSACAGGVKVPCPSSAVEGAAQGIANDLVPTQDADVVDGALALGAAVCDQLEAAKPPG